MELATLQPTIPRKTADAGCVAAPIDNPGCLFDTVGRRARMVANMEVRLRIGGRRPGYTPRYPEQAVLLDLPDGTVLDGKLKEPTWASQYTLAMSQQA